MIKSVKQLKCIEMKNGKKKDETIVGKILSEQIETSLSIQKFHFWIAIVSNFNLQN